MLLQAADRRRVIAALFLSVVAGVAGAGTVVWIGSMLSGNVTVSVLHWLAIVAAIGGSLALDYFAKHTLTTLAAEVSIYVRMNLSRHVLDLPYERYEQLGANAFGSLLIEDSRSLHGPLLEMPVLLVGMAKIIGCGLYLAYVSPQVAVILAIVASVIAFVYRALQLRAYRLTKFWLRFREKESGLTRTILDGMREMSMNAERRWHFYANILRPAVELTQHGWRTIRLRYQAANAFMHSSQMVVAVALLAVASFELLDRARIGEYTVIILYMAASATAMLAGMPAFGEATSVLLRLREHGVDPAVRTAELAPSITPVVDGRRPFTIELCGAVYRHRNGDDDFTLGPIDLTLRSGELVFIVGGNGSGKTTLIKLLVGLYRPQAGEVRIDERLVDDALRSSYRQIFSITFAEAFLLRSLDGYVTGGGPLDERASELLRRLRLDHKVSVHDGMLSSVELSTGQRKRLALLGAYLEDRPVYVFDEWAASQDREFRELFYRELLPELRARGKLVVVISHDDAYYDVADRIVRLDFGRIVHQEEANAERRS